MDRIMSFLIFFFLIQKENQKSSRPASRYTAKDTDIPSDLPKATQQILRIQVVSPGPHDCLPKKINYENNELLHFTHSLRKQLVLLVLAEVIQDSEAEKRFLLGCTRKNQQWALKGLACPQDNTKAPILLSVCAVTVSANGSYTCLEQEKEVFEDSICYQ